MSRFRKVIHSPYVIARSDLGQGVRAGARGQVVSILGLEQAVMVSFGQTLLRCPIADLDPAEPTRPRCRRGRALLAA